MAYHPMRWVWQYWTKTVRCPHPTPSPSPSPSLRAVATEYDECVREHCVHATSNGGRRQQRCQCENEQKPVHQNFRAQHTYICHLYPLLGPFRQGASYLKVDLVAAAGARLAEGVKLIRPIDHRAHHIVARRDS